MDKKQIIIFEAKIDGKWIKVFTKGYKKDVYVRANKKAYFIASALECTVRWLEKDYHNATGHVYIS